MSASPAAVQRVKAHVPEALHQKVEEAAKAVPGPEVREAARERAASTQVDDFGVAVEARDKDKLAQALEQADVILQNRRTNGGGTIAVGGGYRDTEFSRAFWASREA